MLALVAGDDRPGVAAALAEPAGDDGGIPVREPDGLGAGGVDRREEARPVGVVSTAVGSGASTDIATLAPSSSRSVSTTGTATGQGAGALAIGTLEFGDDSTGPAAAGSSSAPDRVVRIRWRR